MEVTTPFPASSKYKFVFFNEETPVRRGLQLRLKPARKTLLFFPRALFALQFDSCGPRCSGKATLALANMASVLCGG